jgi:hypothetical protein
MPGSLTAFVPPVVLVCACAVAQEFSHAGDAAPSPAFVAREKKLVGFSWAMPSPSQLREHMRDLEQAAPYLDGLVFKLPEAPAGQWPPWLPAFDERAWTEADVQLDALREIRWGRFRHNFISLGPGPTYDDLRVSWFDDAAWETVQANLRLLSRAVAVSRARGVFFDTENYSGAWHYWSVQGLRANPPLKVCLYPGFTFPQVEAKVRQRGREFIGALQSEKPDLVLMATFLLSSSGDAPEKVETSDFPLLRAFTEGMLEAAGPQVRLVDGTESTYWTNASDGYLYGYNALRESGLRILPAELHPRRLQLCSSGMAVFYDALLTGLYTDKLPVDREYRLKWLEHNLYHGLLTNDEWTWLYFEKADPWTGEGVPPEAAAALERGKAKALGSQPLGWTMVWQSLSGPVPSKVFDTPTFRITKPAPDASPRASENLVVELAAADGVPLTSAQLYLDSRPSAKLLAPPFRATLTNVPPGTHTLRAVGYFTGDADRGECAPVVFDVTPW